MRAKVAEAIAPYHSNALPLWPSPWYARWFFDSRWYLKTENGRVRVYINSAEYAEIFHGRMS